MCWFLTTRCFPPCRRSPTRTEGRASSRSCRVPDEEVSRFGVIAGEAVSDDVWKIDSLVEKPALEDAPSNLAVFGRYLLSPRVMELLADVEPGVGGEIQLTDALDAVLKEEEMYALIIDPADGFDTGTVESWLETNNILWKRAQGSSPALAVSGFAITDRVPFRF